MNGAISPVKYFAGHAKTTDNPDTALFIVILS